MSWLADLAGKAEDFLNKVDAGAASLTKPQGRTSSFSSAYDAPDSTETSQYSSTGYSTNTSETQQHPYGNSTSHNAPGSGFITAAAGNIKKSKGSLLTSSATVSTTSTLPLGSSSTASSSSSIKPSSSFVRPSKKSQSEQDVDDDLLFDFLNSSDPPAANERREVRPRDPLRVSPEGSGSPQPAPPVSAAAPIMVPSAPSTPPSLRGMSRTSSYSSLSTSTHSAKTGGSEDGSAKESQDTPDGSDSGLAVPQSITYLSESPATYEAPPPALAPPPIEEQQSQMMSSLRLENQLLRSEVTSLNQELASIIQRAKDTQEELNQARLRTEKWNSDQSRTDRAVRELRSQVDDLTEALGAKDGQLAVLKVRLDEADQLLKSRSSALEEAQTERSRILQDHTEGSSMQSQAMTTMQERLREADMALRREQDGYRQMQSEFAVRLSKVEAERQTLAEAVTGAERRASDDKHRVEDLQQQMRSARNAAETAKQELQDYKSKASRILQSKEKLISSLKEGSGLDGLEGGGAGLLELEELRHEKELQRDEIQKLQWREQQLENQEQQARQTRAKQEVEAEVERYKQELQYVEEENHRAKTTLQSRIKDREDEIQKLRNQLTNKALSSSSQVELESRLHQLTETLIQKQTMLESLGTEKSSLVFQLERLETQLKNTQGGGGQTGGPAINMSSMESPGTRQRNAPVLFNDHDSPGVYGQVRKAASTIDRFSIRLGIFLRRFPMARVLVILYMALLHLWVMIVLLTYSPEIHDHPAGT
uniref:golgin subfamily A member 5 isoform X2 n=1 Tax=Oncorhynchus gorbuscha TaxID=8017 RepID=UPI001EAF5EF4|nr:golgin subfamily A member 5 isoform X2 [Oncorhynchus gorbuscha]